MKIGWFLDGRIFAPGDWRISFLRAARDAGLVGPVFIAAVRPVVARRTAAALADFEVHPLRIPDLLRRLGETGKTFHDRLLLGALAGALDATSTDRLVWLADAWPTATARGELPHGFGQGISFNGEIRFIVPPPEIAMLFGETATVDTDESSMVVVSTPEETSTVLEHHFIRRRQGNRSSFSLLLPPDLASAMKSIIATHGLLPELRILTPPLSREDMARAAALPDRASVRNVFVAALQAVCRGAV